MHRNGRDAIAHSDLMPSGKGYSPVKPTGISDSEFDYLKAYLNGFHDNNYTRSPGCPSGAGTDVVIRHSVASAVVSNLTGGIASFAFTGIPEAPIIYSVGGNSSIQTVTYSNMPNTPGVYGAYPPDPYKLHGVGRYRCVSMAVKIEDETPPLYRKGTITAARNPSAVDLVPLSMGTSTDGAHSYTTQHLRVLESLPITEADVTQLSANVYSGPCEEGLYAPLPYLEPLNPFISRDTPERKAVFTQGLNFANINAPPPSFANVLGVKLGQSQNLYMPVLPGPGVATTILSNGLIACHPENMQTLVAIVTGADPVNTVLRVRVVSTWEFVTGVATDWADLVSPPMKTNIPLLALASEVFRGMPAAYPASANAWNDIWQRFKEVYSKYASPLATKVISNLPPNYAVPAAGAKALLDSLLSVKDEIKDVSREVKKAAASTAQTTQKLLSVERPSSSRNTGRRDR